MAAAAGLVTKRLTPKYTAQALDLIVSSFSHPTAKEPLSQVMNLKQRSWRAMAGLFVERCSTDKLSFVVVHDKTDEVQGVMLNEDWKQPPPAEFRQLGEEWKPAQAMFAAANNSFKNSQGHIASGQMLHCLYFSCVSPEMRRLGLMTDMWQESVDVAQRYNYSEMMAHCSTDRSARLAEKLGFEKATAIKYTDFEYAGEKYFSELPQVDDKFRELACFKRKVPSDMY